MPTASATVDTASRYRLAERRASQMLTVLDDKAELLAAEGQTVLAFEHQGGAGGPFGARVSLRFSVGDEFGELHVAGPDGRTSVASVYAAGPIERILRAIGFHEVSRAVVIARRYRFQGAYVRIAHVDPPGWFCEIRPDRAEDLARIVAALGAEDLLTDADAGTARRPPEAERRSGDRRATERRRQQLTFLGAERRLGSERRAGDRRLIALA